MLVLSRKTGQDLVIPQYGIILKILEIRGKQVQVGILAQPNVKVHRAEIWQRIQAQSAQRGSAAADRT